jgi:hypothetical protein
MQNKSFHPGRLESLLLAAALLGAAGCTHTAKINVTPTHLPSVAGQPKSPVHAALVLDPEFSDFQYHFKLMGDTFVFPMGPSLNLYARNVVEHVFGQVTVHASPEAAANSADAILIPRALKADSSMGIWAWDDRSQSLIVEWTLKDAENQNVLWVKPIEGKGIETGGNLFTAKSHEKKLFQKLFDDLSLKTFEALKSSPEIMRLQGGGRASQ